MQLRKIFRGKPKLLHKDEYREMIHEEVSQVIDEHKERQTRLERREEVKNKIRQLPPIKRLKVLKALKARKDIKRGK